MLRQIAALLLEAGFGLLVWVFLARFLMQWARASFANPVGHFVVAASDWAVRPARRLLPAAFGLDLPTLALALLAELILQALLGAIGLLPFDVLDRPFALLAFSAVGVLRAMVHVFEVAIIAHAVLSWVQPYSPLSAPLAALSRPLLAPLRRLLPPLSGIDLTPLVALLLLQIVLIVLAHAGQSALLAF